MDGFTVSDTTVVITKFNIIMLRVRYVCSYYWSNSRQGAGFGIGARCW